ADERPQVNGVALEAILERRIAAELEHRRQVLAVFRQLHCQPEGLAVGEIQAETQDGNQVRRVDVVIVLAEQPVAAGHQLRQMARLGHGPFRLGDRAPDVFDHIVVQRAHQQPDAVVAGLTIRVLFEKRDGAADPVVAQDQLEPFAWMHALVERNFNDRLLVFLRLQFLDGGGDWRAIADGTKIGPGARDVAVGKETPADFTRGGHEIALVYYALGFGQVFQPFVLNEWQSQGVTALHEPRFKYQQVLLLVAEIPDQQIETGL